MRVFLSAWLAFVMALASAVSASAVPDTVALWNMNEAPESSSAVDGSGEGSHGTVGADVRTGVPHSGGTGFGFPDVAPNSPPTRPGHLVTVPHSPLLNPDAGDFTVTVRFRTTRSPSNIVQKGQNGAAGGYWKIEQGGERARCSFVAGNGQGTSVAADVRVDDGEWHTVTCERSNTSVAISVDGVRQRSAGGSGGTIANTWDLAIGGKSDCDQLRVGCDYFSGEIDYVRVQK